MADTTVDLLVVGSGTGMAAALAAHEIGPVGADRGEVRRTSAVRPPAPGARCGCQPARCSQKAAPATPLERAETYLNAVVGGSAPPERSTGSWRSLSATVDMLRRTTPHEVLLGPRLLRLPPGGARRQRGRSHLRVPSIRHVDPRRTPHPTAARRHGGHRPDADDRRRLPLDEPDEPGCRAREFPTVGKRLGAGRWWSAARAALRGGGPGACGRVCSRGCCAPASRSGPAPRWCASSSMAAG